MPRSAPLLLVLALPGCGASPAPLPTTSTVASASASPSPSASVDVAAPPARGSRELFYVEVRGGEKPNGIAVSIDVPPSWGIEDGALGPRLESCASSAELLGTSIGLWARACASGEEGDACVKRLIEADSGKDEPISVDQTGGPSRRWVARATRSKGTGEPTFEGRLYVYDARSRAVVSCGYDMSRDGEKRRAVYAEICATMAVEADAEKPVAHARRAPSADGALGNASEVEDGDALASAALGFFDALAKHDAKGAEAFILGPDDCDNLMKGKPAAALARCKEEMAPTAFEASFDVISKGFPPFESAGAVHLMSMPESKSGKPGPRMYIAYVLDAAKPCATSETGFPVAMVGGKARVLILTKSKKGS